MVDCRRLQGAAGCVQSSVPRLYDSIVANEADLGDRTPFSQDSPPSSIPRRSRCLQSSPSGSVLASRLYLFFLSPTLPNFLASSSLLTSSTPHCARPSQASTRAASQLQLRSLSHLHPDRHSAQKHAVIIFPDLWNCLCFFRSAPPKLVRSKPGNLQLPQVRLRVLEHQEVLE